MALWEPCSEIEGQLDTINSSLNMRGEINEKFIVDVIPEFETEDCIQENMKLKRIRNKLVICREQGDMLTFPKGRYVIHVFNRSNQQVSCNFVIQSNREVTSPTAVFGPTNVANKNLLLKRMYQKIHMSRAVVYEQLGIALRIAWFGPRAILCLKNETAENKIVCL